MTSQLTATVSLSGSTLAHPYGGHLPNPTRPTAPQSQRAVDGSVEAAAFDQFLCWLGPDTEAAAQKYESIRGRLIMMFRARRCVFAEDLADVTFERVARKMTQLSTEFAGDPARYFYGVAKKIYLEYQRGLTAAPATGTPFVSAHVNEEYSENRLDQLEQALNLLSQSDRDLILKYYAGSRRSKIEQRRALAAQFAIAPNALRLRVFRIRAQIKKHMLLHATAVEASPARVRFDSARIASKKKHSGED